MSFEWLLLLFAIPAINIPCVHAGLRELVISDSSSDSERTMKSILESCYDINSLSETVVVVGDFNEFTDKLPIIRMNNFDNLRSDSLSNFKSTRVIIVVDFGNELREKIHSLRKMSWWNCMALFFIIIKNDEMCDYRFLIQFTTMIYGMINSIYICSGSMNTSILYSTNLYANYAPHPWKIGEEPSWDGGFSQQFDKNVSCRSLNYDKTIQLNGHQIQAIYQGNDGMGRKDYFPLEMIRTLIRALNIDGFLPPKETQSLISDYFSVPSVDLELFSSGIEEDPNAKFFYPYSQTRIVAVINSSPSKSIQHKIFHLWSSSVIFLIFIVLAILLLILSWKHHEFSPALLNIIRLRVNSSNPINIRSNSFRIVFTTILIMMIISNRLFQGEMVTFLTFQEKNAAIERIEILVELGYKLYSTPGLEKSIELFCPECRAMTVELDECFKYVLEDRLTACLTEESTYQHVAFMPFDVVKESLVQPFRVTKCRDNWPLYDRVNDVWMRIFESGLPDFWKTQQTFQSLRKRRVLNIEPSSTQYQPIKLHELLFAFKFLAIGLLLSTLVFIGEVLVKKYSCVQWLDQQCAK